MPGVRSFDGVEVELDDGSRVSPDAVIAATGYAAAVDALTEVGETSAQGVRAFGRGRAPGLYAVGLFNTAQGVLFRIGVDARRVARAIARAEVV